MSELPTPINPAELWQSQTEEETNMTLQFVRYKAQEFQNRIRSRNRRESIFAAISMPLFVAIALLIPGLLLKVGSLLLLAATVYVVFDMRKYGSAKQLPTETGAVGCLDFHRAELARQHNLLRRVVTRHIPAQLPGVGLMIVGSRIQFPDVPLIVSVGQVVFGIAVFGLIAFLNLRAANRYQRELDALDAN